MSLRNRTPLQSTEDSDTDDDPTYDKEEDTKDSKDVITKSEPPRYQCTICDKVFVVAARLHRHHRVHTGEKPFKCEFCNKKFSVNENLTVHRRIHTKERPYQCSDCDRAFEHSGKLHRHMRIHTGERPHKCDICEKTFVQSGQLVIHIRSHTGEKPYKCDYCQKRFSCSKQVKVHIRIHTGEKPYVCDICGKTFGYNHVLKMHKMAHLGKKLYKCTLCENFFNSRKLLDRHIKEHGQDSFQDLRSASVENTIQESEIIHQHDPSCTSASHTPTYDENDNRKLRSPSFLSQFSNSIASSVDWSSYSNTEVDTCKLKAPSTNLKDSCQLAYFTTTNGDNLVCPADLVIRMQDFTCDSNDINQQRKFREKLRLQQELLERIRMEQERRTKDELFSESVLRVLMSCIGSERIAQLGYPSQSIDKVIMKTLRLMGTEPCWEPFLLPTDRIKVNLRLLFECCVSDKSLWDQFGWKHKSIEDIVVEFLQQC